MSRAAWARTALLIVDVQVDFLPGGRLPVPEGDRVLTPITTLLSLPFARICASQDWHPPAHASFKSADRPDAPWPVHCVAGSAGAELAPGLDQTRIGMIVRKGMAAEVDSYSAFLDDDRRYETGLAGFLRGVGITRVVVCGLAFDHCVAASAEDAAAAGFETIVIEEACRGIAADPGPTRARLSRAGVRLSGLEELRAS